MILIHLIDLTENNLTENYQKIRSELKSYDLLLSRKKVSRY